MTDLRQVTALLDEINAAVSSYDPVLKEQARDILLQHAFRAGSGAAAASGSASTASSTPRRGRPPKVRTDEDAAPKRRGRPPGRKGTRGKAARGGRGPALKSLLERWTPETLADKALLGAYYLSRIRGETTVTSQAINTELKRNGLPISNITRAIESNMRPEHPLIIQERKMGTTKQARKQYSITPAGLEEVERRLGEG